MPNTLSWEEKTESGKKAGFDYLEMSIDETEEKLARLDQSVDGNRKKAIRKNRSSKIYLLKWSSKYQVGLT